MTKGSQENITAYDLYQKTLSDWASSYLYPIAMEKAKIKEREHEFFKKIFNGFREITNTIDAILLCRTLISTAPPRSKKIQKDAYINLIISSYLQEIYVLQTRLFNYLRVIKKIYRKIDDGSIERSLTVVEDYVKESLEDIVNTRGSHVHEERYQDEHLDRLSTYSFLSQHSHEQQFFEITEDSYTINCKKWKSIMLKNERAITNLLEHYCDGLNKTIVHDGSILKPNKAYDI